MLHLHIISGYVFNLSIPLLSYPMNDAAETVNEIGATVRRVMGGTTGILYHHSC
jgi:hypothetical protein